MAAVDTERPAEWDRMVLIYYQHRCEISGKKPWLDSKFYAGMISWYQEQGCEISLIPEREILWRDQSAKVEFWLRWG